VVAAALVVLAAAAWLRGAEYDEQYTLFLTAGVARPAWPATVFPAASIAALQDGHAALSQVAQDLRTTDVHPPLYFWVVSLWRFVFGPTLFAARLMSVVCGAGSIWLVGRIAGCCGARAVPAMLITLGCYGFAYTNAIARGFALAELLTLAGVALLFGGRAAWAGVCFGAACCGNYLAVFVGAAAVLVSGAWLAIPAAAPFLLLDGWFLAAQHGSRAGQFPPFSVWPSLARLIEYQGAAVFGGLPLYAEGAGRLVIGAALGVAALVAGWPMLRVRRWAREPALRVVVAAAIAPPVGLLALGFVFDNTPIELRYLSFGLPFVALLLARPIGGEVWPRVAMLLALQACGILGLLVSERTMQPARAAAAQAALGNEVVLVPAGNDGVGIVGAFGIEAAAATRVLVVGIADPITERLVPFDRVAVAALAQDRDSAAVIDALHAVLAPPEWRLDAARAHLEIFQRSGINGARTSSPVPPTPR
jgi:hypothetical protein